MANSHSEQQSPYHLVEPSHWPITGSISAFLLTFGIVAYMHPTYILGDGAGASVVYFLPGLVAVLFTMWGWWRRVVRESVIEKAHSGVVKLGLRYGMSLFIASEVMFFVAFFWAYFDASLFPKAATGGAWDPGISFWPAEERHSSGLGQWPPEGVITFNAFELPFLNTLILLLSGCTVTWAHHAVLRNDRKGVVQGLALTVFLGVLFSGLQAFEYSHAPFGFTDGVYSSTFFMATGFHGFHVIVGTIFLTVCLFRAMKGHFTAESHFGLEAAAWYWHFVDVVWLFLFSCVYWWGG